MRGTCVSRAGSKFQSNMSKSLILFALINFCCCSKMNAWDKCYARMSEEYLEVYTGLPEDKSSQVLDIFELKPKNSTGKVILEPVASEIGVPVASSDLPFIIKLEIHPETTCWPVKCFVLMTLSAQDKDRWYQGKYYLKTHLCCTYKY